MQPARSIRNLALVGFMGTGKTTVGHLVSSALHLPFVDTDEMIEQKAFRSIPDIFAAEGEAQFRHYEREVLRELDAREGIIIATGGGLVAQPGNLELLKAHSLVVCLWASPEAIWERVRHQSHRPLLKTEDPLQKIKSLLREREPFYRQADVLVNSELRPLKQVASQVAYHFQLALQPPSSAPSH